MGELRITVEMVLQECRPGVATAGRSRAGSRA
jgi:hypothetical protein